MSANINPIHIDTPFTAVAQISTANTNRDGTGTIGTVKSAGSDGTRIDLIRVVATGTTTAGVVRLFIHDGSSAILWKEVLVTAVTPSTSVEVFVAEVAPTEPILLASGYSLRASTHNAEAFNVFAHGGDY